MDKLDFISSPSFQVFMNQFQHDAINKLITANLILSELDKTSSDQRLYSFNELQKELMNVKKIFDRIKVIVEIESQYSFSLNPVTLLQLIKDLFFVSSKYCSEIEINGKKTTELETIPEYYASLIPSNLFLWRMGLDALISFCGKNNSPVRILCSFSPESFELRIVDKMDLFSQETVENLYCLKYKNPGLKDFALYSCKRIMHYLNFDFDYEVFEGRNSFVIKKTIPVSVPLNEASLK